MAVVPQDLVRAFLNILGNAFRAAGLRTRPEGPQVTVVTARESDRAVIRIRDNGPGIDAGIRDRIFAPFFTTRPAGEGTGLALSIAHDIVVRQPGGRLSVESEPGQYSEFIVELPLGVRSRASDH
ncbi:MAG: sensor histidine kinase [Candidatus Xenobia bacterium]